MVPTVSSASIDPHTLIFSLYGQYVLPRGEEIWVGSLIDALAPLDYSATAVRALISRMKQSGFLCSRRQGRYSFYRLTERGRRQVTQGGQRTFQAAPPAWDGRWTVVAYSVPEKERHRRDALREKLDWWGFGALAPGTWISPWTLPPQSRDKLRKLGVQTYLDIFRAEYLGPRPLGDLVAQAWPDLLAVGDSYRAYIDTYEPLLDRFQAGNLEEASCFAVQLCSLCHFVALTLDDPGLPDPLLPESWPRPRAQACLKAIQRFFNEPAESFFDAIYRTRGPDR